MDGNYCDLLEVAENVNSVDVSSCEDAVDGLSLTQNSAELSLNNGIDVNSVCGNSNNPEEQPDEFQELENALRSLYDYTNRIKSFVEQDYALKADANKGESEVKKASSTGNIIKDILENVLDTVCEGVPIQSEKVNESMSTVESPTSPYLEQTFPATQVTEEEIAVNDRNEGLKSELSLSEYEQNLEAFEIEKPVKPSYDKVPVSDVQKDSEFETFPSVIADKLVNEAFEMVMLKPFVRRESQNLSSEQHSGNFQETGNLRADLESFSKPGEQIILTNEMSNSEIDPNYSDGTALKKISKVENSEIEKTIMKDIGQHQNNEASIYRQKTNTEDRVSEEHRKTFYSESFLESNNLWDSHPCEKNQKLVNVDQMDPETICGLGFFRPLWLQGWATSRVFLVLFSIVGVLQSSYYTYIIGIMSTLEKRYAFESKISGTVMMVDEITPLFFGVLVGYFGGKTHRPRLVAFGMFISSFCCFVTALPYFLYGSAKHLGLHSVSNGTDANHCDRRDWAFEDCDVDDRPPTMTAVGCFLFGSFMKGFGSLAYYSVGMSYLDDTTKKTNTPIYLAICTALRILGPTLGFLMSSAFLKYYENPFEDPGFDNSDPRWIGAWWIGFVLQGIALCVFSFPILLFPRRLPGKRKRAFSNTANFNQENLFQRAAGMLTAVKRLATNPVFILFSLGMISTISGGMGIFAYVPKYMENQFHISASTASLLSGPPALAALQVCCIVGGIIIWKFRPGPKLLVSAFVITSLLDVVSFLVLMVPMCPQINMAGSSLSESGLILENACNSGCGCSLDSFVPVCGPDGVSTYFSPCHAGCTRTDKSDPEKYFDCSCIIDSDGNFTNATYVNRGYCPDEQCWTQMILYVTIITISYGITSLARVGFTLFLFRSVDPADKSLALGAFQMLLCGLAFMPFPVIFGSLADSSCIIWESSCGETGNCWFYDVGVFKWRLHGAAACFAGVGALFYTGLFFLSGRVRNLYEEDDADQKNNEPVEKNSAKQKDDAFSKL